MLLDRHSMAARYACSKEEMRLQLRSVLVTMRETVATDGHMLAVVSHPSEPLRDVDFPTIPGFSPDDSIGPWAPVLVPCETLDRASKSLPKRFTHPILGHALLDPVNCAIATTDLDSPNVVRFKADDRRFPDYAKVIDRDLTGRVNVSLSIPLLERALKIAREGSGNGEKVCSVVVSVKDHQGPVILQAGRAFVLVMPLRGDGDEKPTITLPGSVPVTVPREDVEAPKVSYASVTAMREHCPHIFAFGKCTACGMREVQGDYPPATPALPACQTCGNPCEKADHVYCAPCSEAIAEAYRATIKAEAEERAAEAELERVAHYQAEKAALEADIARQYDEELAENKRLRALAARMTVGVPSPIRNGFGPGEPLHNH